VLVVDSGRVVEFDAPAALLARQDSKFRYRINIDYL
jgi:ABC-type multidrug transport system fused ATPase/permease subunit